jgi:hypothetical protein
MAFTHCFAYDWSIIERAAVMKHIEKFVSVKLGVTLVILTLAGFTNTRHLFRLLNVDANHSYLRIPLTAALLYAGSPAARLKTTRQILLSVGVFYFAIGAIGSADRKVGGLLPSKLTNFDIFYHFAVGAGAVWLGARPGRMVKP